MSLPARDIDFTLKDLLTDRVREYADNVDPEWLEMDERALRRRIKPTPTDYSLRVSFWREYERVSDKNLKTIQPSKVYRGICSEQYFFQKFITNEKKMAWLLKPCQDYQREIEAILSRATQRLWEIVEMDIMDAKGKNVDARRASVLLEAVKMVENRARGMAVQRTMSKTETVHKTGQPEPPVDMGNVDEQIKLLEQQVKPSITVDDVIDGSVIEQTADES